MKAPNILEPKQRETFRDKYLAVILAVAALFICAVSSAQTDSTKYSQINGYGFKYKRMAFDSTLMAPLSTSPHTPYRPGGIRYRASDSTLQLWTGNQWLSIITGVGNGIDTAYMVNDTVLVIETPDQDFMLQVSKRHVDTLYRKPGQDSIFYRIAGVERAILDSTGADSTIFATNYRLDTAKTNLRDEIADKLNSSDTADKWVNDIRREPGSKMVQKFKNDTWQDAYEDSIGIVIAYNGVHRSVDTVKLGDTIMSKYHNIIHYINQKRTEPPTGTGSLIITNDPAVLDTVFKVQLSSDTGLSTHDGLTTNNYDKSPLLVARFYNDNDSLYKLYGGAIQAITLQGYESSRNTFGTNPNYGMALPYGGFNANSWIYPPDTAYLNQQPQGMTPAAYAGEIAIGGQNKYRVTVSGKTNYPTPVSRMGLDFARSSNTVKREWIGSAASYVSDWRSYYGSLNSGTTEYGSYIGKIYGFHAFGNLNSFGSATKEKILAVSKVDTVMGFYAAPMWTATNEVNNGYGFVSDGSNDWNHFKGKLRIGGSRPSVADTQRYKVEIDSTMKLGATSSFNTTSFATAYWRQHGITSSNYSTKKSVGLFIEHEMQFANNAPDVYNGNNKALLVHFNHFGDSIIQANNTSNTVSGTNAAASRLIFRKNPGYGDTTYIIGGISSTNGPSAYNATIDFADGGGVTAAGKPNLGVGWFSALTTSYQFAGAYNIVDHAIWLNVAQGQAGAVNTVKNGYGLYLGGFSNSVTNKYSIYQAGTADTNYLAGKTRFPNLAQQTDEITYKPLAVDALGNVNVMQSWNGSVVVVNDANHTVTTAQSAVRYHADITGNRTLTIPNPSSATNREIWVKWNTIDGGASLNITTTSGSAAIYLDGTASSTTYNITASNQSALLKSDGTSWYKIN